jgi:hypothetical protein
VASNTQTSQVTGNVNATLALSVTSSATLGAFNAGITHDYDSTVAATVNSSAGDATLSISDPSATSPGHLVNGTFSLAQSLQARATNAAHPSTAFAPVSNSPLALLSYAGPVSNDQVTIGIRQSINATDPLRTGTYSKTLTFTLSTTTP